MLNKLLRGSLASLPENEPPFNWRDHLPVHPLADAYPKVPHERLVEIGESVRRSGLEFPILINAKGDPGNPELFELFDGITRLNAMAAVGIKFEFERFRFARGSSSHGHHSLRLVIHDVPTNPDLLGTTKIFHNLSGAEIADKIEIANLHRRHLESEQYHARIEASHARIEAALKRDPEKSDRVHAEEQGVSDKTIAKVRKSTAEGSAVGGKRVGKDGRARKQPAKKPEPAPKKTADSSPADGVVAARAVARRPKCQPAAAGLDPMTFADAPLPERTKYLDAVGAKALLAALPLSWLDAVGAWLATHDARPVPAAPASNSDDLKIPLCLRRDLLPATPAADSCAEADEPAPNAAEISREQIVGEFFAGADVADILARLPQETLNQIREQVIDSWFGNLDLDAVLDRVPSDRWSELTDLCISACISVSTVVVPVKTPRKLLRDLNGTLRWALDQEDVSSAGDGVKRIRAKLTANKRDVRELRLHFVKEKS